MNLLVSPKVKKEISKERKTLVKAIRNIHEVELTEIPPG